MGPSSRASLIMSWTGVLIPSARRFPTRSFFGGCGIPARASCRGISPTLCRDVAGHEEEVPRAARAVDDEVLEDGLGSEAEALEGGDGALLVRRHPRHELLEPEPPGDLGDLE